MESETIDIIHALIKRVKRLELELSELRQQTAAPFSNAKVVEETAKNGKISPHVCQALRSVNIKINTAIARAVQNHDESRVSTAIDAFKQARQKTTIAAPEAWLVRAIQQGWKPNAQTQTRKQPNDDFNAWFELARAKQLVVASIKQDDELFVILPDGSWRSFETMLSECPTDSIGSEAQTETAS